MFEFLIISSRKQFEMRKHYVLIAMLVMIVLSGVIAKKTAKQWRHKMKNQPGRHVQTQNSHHYLQPNQIDFWLYSLLALFLSVAGGFCSGMTVGLNSLSVLNLQLMKESSDEENKKIAERILSVISDHHLFLVTLLICNAIVLESLPLVIHLIMPDWAAILFSTFIVLIVAEVVPMSLTTGQQKYLFAYYGAPLVLLLIKIFYVVSYPIARGLDKLLQGDKQQRIYRQDFLTFINNKHKNQLDEIEIEFINQVMNYKHRKVTEFMIPSKSFFMIEENQQISDQWLYQLSQNQYTYVLVYSKSKHNIIGYVKSAEVIIKFLKKIRVKKSVKELKLKINRYILKVYADSVAVQILEIFKNRGIRIVLICENRKHANKEVKDCSQIHVGSVYDGDEMIVQEKQATIIGAITLNRVLKEIANYPTQALIRSSRKLSGIDIV